MPNFYPIDRDQMFLLPISIKDWLPGDDLAWFVLDVVGQMDRAGFYARYRAGRLVRLKEAKARLEKEAADKATAKEARANVTDPESPIMKTRSGYVQGYNAQAIVNQDQVIIACAVTQEANDVHQLHPMLERTHANLAAVGVAQPVGVLLADGEWNLLGTSHNLPKLFRRGTKGPR